MCVSVCSVCVCARMCVHIVDAGVEGGGGGLTQLSSPSIWVCGGFKTNRPVSMAAAQVAELLDPHERCLLVTDTILFHGTNSQQINKTLSSDAMTLCRVPPRHRSPSTLSSVPPWPLAPGPVLSGFPGGSY